MGIARRRHGRSSGDRSSRQGSGGLLAASSSVRELSVWLPSVALCIRSRADVRPLDAEVLAS